MVTAQQLYQFYLKHPIVCTDTRKITKNCLFFALKGDNYDANTFATEALSNGAAFAIIDNPTYQTNSNCILVPDVLTALQDLAKYHRAQLSIPIIGLTGSNGKTTTKELIRAILAQQYQTFATEGNLNNHIGVPLSILAIGPTIQIAVIEMGANHQKEIAFLSQIAQPTHGLITNVGLAHLEGFGGFEGVKKGKAELYDYLKIQKGVTFINTNDTNLLAMCANANINKFIGYGSATTNFVSGNLLHTNPLISLQWQTNNHSFTAQTNLTGSYNFENILAAICIACYFKLTATQINQGLANYLPNNNRSQLSKTAKNTLICDFYNANPSSMNAAITNLAKLNAENKTAILGDMFELGNETELQHQKIIAQALQNNFSNVVFIGENFYALKAENKGLFFKNTAAAAVYLMQNNLKANLVLLKGSRGMALESLLPFL